MNEEILNKLETASKEELLSVSDLSQLETWRIKYLGRKGGLLQILHRLGELPPEERVRIGKRANEIKNLLFGLFKEKEQQLKTKLPFEKEEFFDFTLPGHPYSVGHRHPLAKVFTEIVKIFSNLGFAVAEGPEIETDYYNFEALNFPKDHPARDMQNSFYLQLPITHHPSPQEYLLRTHTSPVQIRVMEKNRPPIRIIAPGRVFRHEAIDPSHLAMFHQVEGLTVDEKVTFADLKGTLTLFVQKMFGKETKARFRPSYFPFVEPGAEVDISCIICSGKGCRVCKNSGYLELLGAGMVHTKVFQAVGYNPNKYTGFAFGLGVERVAMLKYGVDDLRLFYSNDLRFLSQF